MDKFRNYVALLLLTTTCHFISTSAHVSLTFPPARNLNLDFLDCGSTKMPCGMPKGKLRTTLKAGSTVNVTWHLANPHMGGLHLELLDKDGNVAMTLSDHPSSASSDVIKNILAQWHNVKIPDMHCEDCTIRLIQQISEAPIEKYCAFSCADISIVKESDYKEDCLGRGMVGSNSACTCNKEYSGDRCQYKNECVQDGDCGRAGKCIDIAGTNLPQKQCFCSFGAHGEHCQLENKDMLPTSENLQLSSHTKIVLSDRVTLYYKMIPAKNSANNEVEFAVIVNGTSYVAIGWRPASLDESCKGMPAIDDENMASADPVMLNEVSPLKLEKRKTPYFPNRPFHPMDCSDIIIGTARDLYSRVRDFYTRDIASPRLDTFYGGTEDIASATGWEQNGVTTIIFRRKVKTSDLTDHELSGPMQVIWAIGQEQGKEMPGMTGFFVQDELKYHGTAEMMQRGVTHITFP